MRALVTGGAGFIGSHLTRRLLAEKVEVIVLDDLSTGRRENLPEGVEFQEGNVLDPDLMLPLVERCDLLFHLAAKVTIRGSVESFFEDAQTNLCGTLALLEACRRAKRRPRRFIFASSMAVYGDAATLPIAEAAPLTPGSPYGISKKTSEEYLELLAPMLGMEWVTLRYFNTYGERQGLTPYVGVITIFLDALRRASAPTIFGTGEQTRDFIYAGDLARATWLAATVQGAAGNRLNVGTGRGTSVNQLFRLLGEILGKTVDPMYAPLPPGEPTDSVAHTKKAEQLLGFRAKAKLEEKLRDLV